MFVIFLMGGILVTAAGLKLTYSVLTDGNRSPTLVIISLIVLLVGILNILLGAIVTTPTGVI